MSNRSPKLHSEVYSESISHVDGNKRKSSLLVSLSWILSVFRYHIKDWRLFVM